MHIFFSILWKIVRNETSTIIPARVSNEKASTTPHIYRWTPCTPQTCVSHKTALQHSASTTIRQHYHTDTWLPQWPAIQTRSAREREREKSAREPLQATSITSGVTGWRKPVREAKPRHSKHETASDKKPCPPNGVREKKGGLLGSASTCTCYCRRPSMRTQSQKVAGCKLKHITTGQCVWRLPRCAMQLCCESTLTKASFVVVSQLLLTEEPPTDVDCEPNTWSAGWQGCTKDIDAKHLFQRCHLQAVPRSIFLHGPYGAWL